MTDFAIHANGTFWGTFSADDGATAIQMEADEFGNIDVGETHASKEGMTATDLRQHILALGAAYGVAQVEQPLLLLLEER